MAECWRGERPLSERTRGLVGKTASVRLIPVPAEVWIPVWRSFLVVWILQGIFHLIPGGFSILPAHLDYFFVHRSGLLVLF